MRKIHAFIDILKGVNKIYSKGETSKSLTWLLRDYSKFRLQGKVSVIEYENYKLASKDTKFRETFLSYTQAQKYWEVLNPRKYACLARDKYIGHCLLEKLGIPTSTLIAYYNPECATSKGNVIYKYSQLEQLLKDSGYQSFVIKPSTDSAHGKGVIICRELITKGDELYIRKTNGSEVSLRQIVGNEPLLFESLVTQTSQMAQFNSSSLNTVRVMTALYPDNTVKIFGAFIKIGREGSDIDNAGNGGNIDAGVDLVTGQIYNTVEFNGWNDIRSIENHPDSNAKLEGEVIIDWERIKEQLKLFQGLIPQLKVIGWDVAITEEGPKIIEINNWWDTTGQEFIGRGWAPEVKDCYDAWVKNQID